MSTILVTGGAGYIGSHVVQALVKSGERVVTVDNLSEGHREAVAGGELLVGDLKDSTFLNDAFRRWAPDAVMHFAASCYVGESVKDPAKYYENNVVNLLNLLSAMRRASVQRFIFSSTAAVYGLPGKVPIDEDQPLRPINPYGTTKLVGELLLEDYARAYNLHYASLRYFNAAGADPSGLLGESHDPETHLIPSVLAVAAGRIPQVEVFGTDYPTADGTCIRDYVHVNDIARAHIAALQSLADGEERLVVNLGNSQGYSVFEIIHTAERVTGKSIRVLHCGRREGDPPVLVCDNRLAKKLLNWSPEYSLMEEILSTAWNWELHRKY